MKLKLKGWIRRTMTMNLSFAAHALFIVIFLIMLWAFWWYVWDVFLRWLRVLWVCRVPALSGALGVVLFWLAEPARDLFLESPGYWGYWIAFFAAVLGWAVSVHFTARKLLEQQAWGANGTSLPLSGAELRRLRQRYVVPAIWIPRLLGFLCVVAVSLGIWGAHRDIAPIRAAFDLGDPLRLLWVAAICLILYLGYILVHAYLSGAAPRPWNFKTFLLNATCRRRVSLLSEVKPFWFLDLSSARRRAARAAGKPAVIRWDLLTVALLGTQSLAWIVAIIAPLQLADILSRAIFVVAMLALPVSLLSFFSALSHLWRVPLVLASFAVLIVLSGMATHFHDLRTVANVHGLAQTGLHEAVAAWRTVNCPEQGHDGAACQARPVIVASAGGASRAAFFTATIIGEILDRRELSLQNRLFAISGVSGGSVGAVMIRAALADARSSGRPPCAKLDDRWFGPYQDYGEASSQKKITWRNCLQTLLAGDFLSPPFIGLTFRDIFGFLPLNDRAALLELAFERRYNRIVRDMAGEEGSSLGRFVGEAPKEPRPAWIPLLLLNATSVKEGRRSIISDLRPYVDTGGQPRRLFPMAFDVFETLGCEGAPCATGSAPVLTGIRLSTAAAASARFPLISPQANVWHGDELRDLLVDGGYFENDGLTTARELAEALVEAGLKPIIVHITNNPVSDAADVKSAVPLPAAPRPAWYEALSAPFEALFGTRDGHAIEALDRARRSTGIKTLTFQVRSHVPKLAKDEACTFANKGEIDLQEEPMKDLSMSWWLSGAVQAYLDRQLCHPSNVAKFEELLPLLILR